jgi:hypothetical protein
VVTTTLPARELLAHREHFPAMLDADAFAADLSAVGCNDSLPPAGGTRSVAHWRVVDWDPPTSETPTTMHESRTHRRRRRHRRAGRRPGPRHPRGSRTAVSACRAITRNVDGEESPRTRRRPAPKWSRRPRTTKRSLEKRLPARTAPFFVTNFWNTFSPQKE